MLQKLEKYEIYEEIGHGGMATVYRALDTVLKREVALKVMHPHLRAAEEARQRFHREAQSVARLRHPGVLEIYDFSNEGSAESFIAAELLTGPTLKVWREDLDDLPAEIAAAVVIEIARALGAAHSAGIIHRDVKPENVLLHEARTLKLTDFGIADMVDAQSMTATGQILGSPGHMAPEQIEGRDCDARTDLFSLGTVLYYLATGRLPFSGRNPHQILKRIVDGDYVDPLRVNPMVGEPMRRIIVRSLSIDPSERYQDAGSFIEALRAFLRSSGIDDSQVLFRRYLKDSKEVAAEVCTQVISTLIDTGRLASEAGDVPAALDAFNRVLALDEGNETVLKLITQVGLDRRRRKILAAGFALLAVGLVTGLGAFALWPDPNAFDPNADPNDPSLTIAALPGSLIDAGVDGGLSELEPDAGFDGGQTPLLVNATIDAGRTQIAPPDPTPSRPPSRAREPREVQIDVEPAQVRISVDGAPAREYGPHFHSTRLRPGSHTFAVEAPAPPADHWRDGRFQIEIPSGTGAHRIQLRLPYASAALVVSSSVPGAVVVGAGVAQGATGSLITVPMRSLQTNQRIRVSAPGHRPQEQFVTLEAGRTLPMLRITLDPLPSEPSTSGDP